MAGATTSTAPLDMVEVTMPRARSNTGAVRAPVAGSIPYTILLPLMSGARYVGIGLLKPMMLRSTKYGLATAATGTANAATNIVATRHARIPPVFMTDPSPRRLHGPIPPQQRYPDMPYVTPRRRASEGVAADMRSGSARMGGAAVLPWCG